MNINRLRLEGSQLPPGWPGLCGEPAALVGVKRKKKKQLLFSVTLNTEFTSPASCQCARAPVHHRRPRPSLACEDVKTIKVCRTNLCLVSRFVSRCIFLAFFFFLRSLSRPERPQVQANHAGALQLALVTCKLEDGAAAGVVQVFRACAARLKEDAVCFLPF